jgi:predicted nuclease with RNAse H fold
MRTLGIDLAAQRRNTAICVIEWDAGDVSVSMPDAGFENPELLAHIQDVDAVGIDAPFGWPEAFTDSLSQYADRGTWPMQSSEQLMYRETDRAVRELLARRDPAIKLNALSVSSDRIAPGGAPHS